MNIREEKSFLVQDPPKETIYTAWILKENKIAGRASHNHADRDNISEVGKVLDKQKRKCHRQVPKKNLKKLPFDWYSIFYWSPIKSK